MDKETTEAYWRKNLKYLIILVALWFITGYVLSLFLVEPLNQFTIGGFPLGFWMSMQGSIVIFIILMFVYVWLMNKLDAEFGLEEE